MAEAFKKVIISAPKNLLIDYYVSRKRITRLVPLNIGIYLTQEQIEYVKIRGFDVENLEEETG